MSIELLPLVRCLMCGFSAQLSELNTERYTFDNPDYNFYRITCELGCKQTASVFELEMPMELGQLNDIISTLHVPVPPQPVIEAFVSLHGYMPPDRRELNIDEAVEAERAKRFLADGSKWDDLFDKWVKEAG